MTLQNIDMFKSLTNMELAKLLGKLEKRELIAGESLFHQGDAAGSMYLIESGRIELFSERPEGGRQALALLHEGDTLGEMALLTGEPRSASAVAAADTVLFEMDRPSFDRLVAENSSISAYFIRLLSQRLIQTNNRLQASKESEAKLTEQRMKLLPEKLQAFLIWCAAVPVAGRRLAERKFGFVLADEAQAWPGLLDFLQADAAAGEWIALKPGVRPLLVDLAASGTASYAERQEWVRQAASSYEEAGQWAASVQLWAELDHWEAALDAAQGMLGLSAPREAAGSSARAERTSEPFPVPDALTEQERETLAQLWRCPPGKLVERSRFPLAERYIAYCQEEAPEKGLALAEAVLEEQAGALTPSQLLRLYERGADLSRRLNRNQQALEYLELAEAAALQITDRAPRSQGEGLTYEQAKQKLVRRKSQQLAESAGRLLGGSRWLGLSALLAAAGCVLLFQQLEPVPGLSRAGMSFIGIGLAAVILWIVNIVPDYIVALGMAMLWVLSGAVTPEVALSGFATTTWLYMIFIMALSAVMTKSGIVYRFSLHALKRFPSHYRGQLWGIVAGGTALNPLLPSSSAKVSLGVPIARTLSESMGFAEKSKEAAGLGLAAMIFYGFTAPFVMTGSYTNVMAYGLVSASQPVTWLQWLIHALPAFVLFSAVLWLAITFMFRNHRSAAKAVSAHVLDEQIRLLGPLTKEERISLFTLLGCVSLLVLQPLHGIDSVWVMLAGFAVLVITGVLDRRTLTSGIDWTFLLFLGIAFSFAGAATELGIADVLSSLVREHMGIFVSSSELFLAAVVLLSFVVTLVVRDDPAVILLVTALLPLGTELGIHPWVLVFIILLSTDPFFFAYQSPTYLTAYYSSEGKAFDHRQGQKIALAYGLAVLLIAVLCVPYWRWLGLIS
ncbi:SLC13 family permease [Paenibacillus puerhi]|uniref:SLC13 family permease n=1 Tax=Paenibacillus puerhi TaxID=2692622 RepID=UPI001356FCFD|nr:SLC13 family permease [Paenibacillus puerhi]